jgi:hypothetical protein
LLTSDTSYAKLKRHLRFFYYGKGRQSNIGMLGVPVKKLHDEPKEKQSEAAGAQ